MRDADFFNEAKKAAQESTCLKIQTGAVVVKDGKIIGKGANLCSPSGFNHGKKVQSCPRTDLPSGEKYELCKPIHAEIIAVLNAGPKNCKGAVMYLSGHYYACWHCQSVACFVGIKEIKCQGEKTRNFYKNLEMSRTTLTPKFRGACMRGKENG